MAAEWDSLLTMDDIGRDRFLAAIDGIVVGANPRQGFVRDDVFYHPDLAFRFPQPRGWTLYNLTTKVAMTDANQQVVVILSLASGSSARDAASSFADESQVNVLDHGATQINGLDAYQLEASIVQEQQQLRLAAYFIEYDGRVYQFLGYTYASRFADMEREIRTPATGFRTLQDPSILGIQPDRLQIIRTSRSGALSSFVRDLPEQFQPEDIAILNQLELNSSVDTGVKLKLVSTPKAE